MQLLFCFFFSIRIRHTRCHGDWSSDVCSSDLGTDGVHGCMPFELECLVRFGVAPPDALLAGTRWAAEACRVDAQVGTVAAGKRADLIALTGDPLTRIEDLQRIRAVMKDGVIQ